MYEAGYIKLFRQMLSWEWYDDANTLKLFIHLLLTVNHTDEKWHGVIIQRGSRVTSLQNLAKELHFTKRQLATHITRLKTSNEVIQSPTSKYSVFTVKNYDRYQSTVQPNVQQNVQQNVQRTCNEREQYKKYKEVLRNKEGVSTPLTPSALKPMDETKEERAARIAKLKE